MEREGQERRPLPRRPSGQCFGCRQANGAGLHMEFAVEGEVVVSEIAVPASLRLGQGGARRHRLHHARRDHGLEGDHLLPAAGAHQKKLAVDFLGPVFAGERLTVRGTIVDRRSEREALLAGEIRTPDGELCATGRAVFALLTPEAARDFAFLDEEIVEEFTQQFPD